MPRSPEAKLMKAEERIPSIMEHETMNNQSIENWEDNQQVSSTPSAYFSHDEMTNTESLQQNNNVSASSSSRKKKIPILIVAAAVVFVGAVVGAASRVIYSSSDLSSTAVKQVSSGSAASLRARSLSESKTVHDPIHLVYSSDAGTVIGTKASIRSVKAHASGHVIFHFIGDEPLEGMPYVRFYPIHKLKHKYHLDDFINTHSRHKTERENVNLNRNLPNYVRFVMDEFLPHVKKAMWIDSDTIVKCDVVSMARSVLKDGDNDYPIAAIPVEGKPKGLYTKDKYKNDIPDWGIETSFNAGVYFVDLDRWRKQGLTEKARKLALKNREFRYWKMGSQPPLALTIGENFERLPLSWNVKMKTIDEREDMTLEDACVLHWSGPFKPWDGFQHPEEWLPYVDESDKELVDTERKDA